jgi:hypothetical protein
MASFNDADQIRKANEGLYAPKTSAMSETYAGIDRSANPNWSGWAIIDKHKPALVPAMNLALSHEKELQAKIIKFYLDNYWNPLKLSQIIDQNVANCAYDASVNMGLGIAAKFMQRACNALKSGALIVDGIIGNQTLTVINSLNGEDVYNQLNELRRDRYIDIANAEPNKRQFLKTWLARLKPYNHNLINH